jgi:nucleotide-binding universal stress UspA family protein
MKKIIVVFNEIATPHRVLDFAINTAKEMSSPLQGIYLKELSSERFKYPFPNDLELTEKEQTKEAGEEVADDRAKSSEDTFEAQCRVAGISCTVQKDFSEKDLINESSSADLIIADAKIEVEAHSLNNILSHIHCPVYLVGLNAPVAESVILTYDGSELSKHAIEKYSELFPHQKSLPATLASVNLSEADKEEDSEFLSQWAPGHFQQLIIKDLQGNVKEEIINLFQGHDKNILLVMGAFGRNAISRFFHPSLAATLIEETRISFFLAHK